MTTFVINPDICIGCRTCENECPASAITAEKKEDSDILTFVCKINIEDCLGCGTCRDNCPVEAISEEN